MALEEARKQNMMSVALLGYGSGEISGKAWLISPLSRAGDSIPRIQEVQASIYHIIRDALEDLTVATLELFGTRPLPAHAGDEKPILWLGAAPL